MKFLPLKKFLIVNKIISLYKSLCFCLFTAALFLTSCAQKGTPSGGPKDITPPVLLRATPDTFSKNVSTRLKEIQLEFDEYVVLKDNSKNIVVSPNMKASPTFLPSGTASKKVKVVFNDSLKKNTTYVINFGKAIQDNNEGNPYNHFNYVFSTGEFIDSLSLSGNLRDLMERKLEKETIAALFLVDNNYNDSIVFSGKPNYIAEVDSTGSFKFNYLHAGNYQLIAFTEETENKKLDKANEKMAFYDSIINPGNPPKNIQLALFTPPQDYRFSDGTQKAYGTLEFVVEGNPETLEVNSIEPKIEGAISIRKAYGDTLQYFFNPEKLDLKDRRTRMRFSLTHHGKTDTIPPIVYDNKTENNLSVFASKGTFVPGSLYKIGASNPISSFNKDSISIKKDSTLLDFEITQLSEKELQLTFPIAFESGYKIELLPGAITDFFGKKNDSLNFGFTTKKERDYGNLQLKIDNKPAHPFWLQLLSSDGKVVSSTYGSESTHNFRFLSPGKYYFKLLVDTNNNQRWDTGDILQRKAPEPVYIYPENINVKAYWDLNETWVLKEP